MTETKLADKRARADYRELEAAGPGFRVTYALDFFNGRVRALDYQLASGGAQAMRRLLQEEATGHGLGKVIVFSREAEAASLEACGFTCEGRILGYFRGEGEARCLSLFPNPLRRENKETAAEDRLLTQLLDQGAADQKPGTTDHKRENAAAPPPYVLRPAVPADADELAALYGNVFASYPTPMDPSSISRAMAGKGYFRVICRGEQIVSAASADVNRRYLNAELTDCATLPEHRGQGLMEVLLKALEEEAVCQGLASLYTLARAGSQGINKAFWRLGYSYGGRMVNNCHIAGRFEDMNIWSKTLNGG